MRKPLIYTYHSRFLKVIKKVAIIGFSLYLILLTPNSTYAGFDSKSRDQYIDFVCSQIPQTNMRNKCECCAGKSSACDTGESPQSGVWTAIGCIDVDPATTVKSISYTGLLLSGGLAILSLLYASFRLTISQGDPKQVTEARELISSVVIGLLFIILSVAILRFIGADVLRVPEFAGN